MKVTVILPFLLLTFLIGCGSSADATPPINGPLKVVATTSLIADVVHNIGGDTIELTTLIGANQDSHSYEATPSDLVALEQANLIFINGWDLEEQLAETIEDNYANAISTISEGIEPIHLDDSDDHEEDEHDDHGHGHGNVDPHVWFSIANVKQWATNAADALTALDPDNGAIYAENLANYHADLQALQVEVEEELAVISADNRKLVTNHEAFGYFARDYDFDLVGTIIPATSTSAEPSASDLADLIEAMSHENVCTLFAETSQNTTLAKTVASELKHCDAVQLLSLYTEAVGEDDASTYIGMFRSNVETIITGLNAE